MSKLTKRIKLSDGTIVSFAEPQSFEVGDVYDSRRTVVEIDPPEPAARDDLRGKILDEIGHFD